MPNKTIKIIFFGDVVGSLGRKAVKEIVPIWQKKYQPEAKRYNHLVKSKQRQKIFNHINKINEQHNINNDRIDALSIDYNEKYVAN